MSLPLGIPLVLVALGMVSVVGWVVYEWRTGINDPFGEAPPGFRAVDGYRLEGRVRGRAVAITCSRSGPRRTVIAIESRLGVPPSGEVLRQLASPELRRRLVPGADLDGGTLEIRFDDDAPRGAALRAEVERLIQQQEVYERATLAPWFKVAEAHDLELVMGSPLMLRGDDELYEVKRGRVDALVSGFPKGLSAGAREDFQPVGNPVLDLLIGVSEGWPEGSEEALLAVVHGYPGSTVRDGRLHLILEQGATPDALSECIRWARTLRAMS